MLHTVVFIGRSGSGKGTQAGLFKDRVHRLEEPQKPILYIETGDHFREFIKGESYSSKLSKAVHERDERQPDFLACFMWSSILIEDLLPDMHLVFDGAPRALDEAQVLTTAMEFYQRENPTVIYLNVSREWAEKRLLARHRTDDVDLARIDKRLDWFDKDVVPALEYFQENPLYKFIEVNGEQSIEAVHSEIVAKYEYGS